MRVKLTRFLKQYSNWFLILGTLSGFVCYALQSWDLAHHLTTIVWDEGMYLYKGYLFAIGDYFPFEDFGPWTNQMPVSFLVPGYVQKLFGFGMFTGRTYAVVLGCLTMVGLWLASYRLGGKWWAAGIVWVVALNSGWMKALSLVYSQGLVSFFFAWMLALAAGRDRKTWELCLAAVLAGLAGMSRINVLPVVFLFMLYVIWQYGWKKGAWVIGAGLVPIVLFHALYWPEILKIWAYWIPPELYSGIIDFRSPWREVFLPENFSWWPVSIWWGNPKHLAWNGIYSILLALRSSFVPFWGALVSLLLWPKRENWKTEHHRKFSVFLVVVYFFMFAVHLWASMGGKSCQFFCLPGYMLFFNFFGLVLIVSSASSWKFHRQAWKQIAILFLVLVLVLVMESSYEQNYLGVRNFFGEEILLMDIPRFKSGERLPGSVTLVQFLKNKFGWKLNPLRNYILYDPGFDRIVTWSVILGIFIVCYIFLRNLLEKVFSVSNKPFIKLVVISVFSIGILSASTRFFVQGLDAPTCEDDVISGYEQVGYELNEIIPSGERIFWAVKSDMLLLYLPEVDIYLPQANSVFTLVDDPNASWEELQKFGFWNYELREYWSREANYVVVENRFFGNGWDQRVAEGEFEVILRSSNPESCRAGLSNVVVLKRVSLD